ncbi:branched-chain amino acid ABC transporter permease [Aeromicrobium sp. Root344]|uniref:AzlC family ABC transporter permease n=1 Tax=Aeromicrobium sp. Root344 TaxID=1736521 RepID=UPI0006F7341C|nr:AzlC family ABC transporter permease [Aeromicrobium sp. Root344]KQV76889.1 branched-chain amino acid ABC transporter permease [Aeromicrobium sp. Root344]
MTATDRSVIVDSLGVGLATGAYGVSFGAISTTSGLDVLQTCVLSLLVFTGASQFAFIGIIASGGNPVTGALTAVLLGSRNLFYGLSLAQKLDLNAPQRLGSAHFVIDESTAMAVTRETRRQTRLGFYWTGISIFVLWNLMTYVGAVAGEKIGDPQTYGLDAAVGAAFLGLLWPRLTSWHARLVALFGAAVALGLVPVTAAGLPIILGGGAAVVLGMLWRPKVSS